MDAGYSNEARTLLAKLIAIDADVHLRSLVMKAKCEELERALRFVDTMHERRARACDARLVEAKSQDAQTQQMHESIKDAIQRARNIREAMAKTGEAGDDGKDGDESGNDNDGDGAAAPSLQNILAMAKSIRTKSPLGGANSAARAPPAAPLSKEPRPKSASPPMDSAPASPQVRLEYPRRMKLLLGQLRDLDEKESHESFRFVFCRKMIELVSLNPLTGGTTTEEKRDAVLPLGKVQTGYPKQVARLQHGYTLVADFMTQRVDVSSEKFQSALHSPYLPTVFPIYTRVKQAAIAHRDGMLKRLTKQSSSASSSLPDAVSNENLLSSSPELAMADHRAVLGRLQVAWEASQGSTLKSTSSADRVFEATLKEIVLTDTSNLILSFFKTIFCDNPDDPEPVHVKNMLLLIRLVDSVAMKNGRRLRSAISSPAS